MSFSNPRPLNPVEKYIEWSGSEGKLFYYDKEQSKKVFMDLPVYFIPLDETTSIGGFNDDRQAGYYSNQIKNISEEKLTVRLKKEVMATGSYREVMAQLRDAKYVKNVYALLIQKDKTSFVCFKFTGSSIGPYIEAKPNIGHNAVLINENPIVGKKGATEYFIPVLTKKSIPKQFHEVSVKADKLLQDYFSSYKNDEHEEVEKEVVHKEDLYKTEDTIQNTSFDTDEEDDLPF